ncbi:transcriptional regulator [Olleya sp. HaHaR_3_96]|uniref:helix-turn-helix transcriptional regulator n=1 Tax=Olleya sp. HaHaR_3_96 TaxID=2745560 RepID=UPI001C50113A|nr:helix-turn-helix transcriptional regulator [Olleya sp. HaHaR_3_96]QXP58372.1 helix-turn-helix transcriptional regulator [Olleya sp. HaHaR_3_96]
MSNNLNTKVTKTATSWKTRAKLDRGNRRNIKRAQLFALELLDYMETHKIKQKDLAERMDVSPQQVNKILRAKSNLTFETLDKIEVALGITITAPKIKVNRTILSQDMGRVMQIVHKRKQKVMETDLSSIPVTKRNPLLVTTMESVGEYKYTADQI